MIHRRQFLAAAGALALAAKEGNAESPFDSLPPNILQNARHNGLCMIRHSAPLDLSSHAQIVPNDEPGSPLIVSGKVFTPDGGQPAPGVTVYAYNTNAQGHYTQNHVMFPPRLYGWMKTDANGRFDLHTILPGRYPAMQVPAHIHFTLWGAGYPLQWVDDLRFEGDSYLRAAMHAESDSLGDFRTIQPVTKAEDGTLRCNFKIKLQRNMNFT